MVRDTGSKFEDAISIVYDIASSFLANSYSPFALVVAVTVSPFFEIKRTVTPRTGFPVSSVT